MSTQASNEVGRIETHGIDLIPHSERTGNVHGLFWLWLATNLNLLFPITGALLVGLGLNFVQALPLILIGNVIGFGLQGLTSLQGPKTGTTTFVVSRAAFGKQGGRLTAFLNWLTVLGFEGSGVALAVLAAQTLLKTLGYSGSTTFGFTLLLIGVVILLQVLVPVLGHATILWVQKWLAWVFAVSFLVITGFAGVEGKVALTGGAPASLSSLSVGLALVIVSGGLSWANTSSDYSRYLPEQTRSWPIVFWVALAGFLPGVLLEVLGVAVTSTIPTITDPINGLASVLPAWLLVPYLLNLVLNLLAANGVDLYSSGLTLQAIGVRLKRWMATCLDMMICIPIAALAVLNNAFNTLYSQFLELLVVFLAPWVAIYLVDALLRRNRYVAQGLLQSVAGPYQYWRGINWAGVIALLLGMTASLLWLNSALVRGPLSSSFGNSDLSFFTGFLVGGLLYFVFVRATISQQRHQVVSTLEREGSA